MRVLRIVARSLAGIIAIAALFYLVALVVNRRDQPPSADVIHLRRVLSDRPPVADVENAFVYVLGIQAARDRDPQVEGARRMRWLAAANRGAAKLSGDPLENALQFSSLRAAELSATFDDCGPDAHERCPAAFHAAPERDAWTDADRLLLDRYHVLIAHSAWREIVPTDPSLPLPAYQYPIGGQRLHLLTLRGADPAALHDGLARDLAFWRTMLASSDTLISKMIAVAGLRHHFYFGNLLLRGRSPADVTTAIPEGWRQPLTPAELSFESVMAGEYVFSSGTNSLRLDWRTEVPDWYEDVDANPLRWRALRLAATPFYQPQDDNNHLAADCAAAARAFSVPVARFPEAARTVASRKNPDPFPSRLYNFVGDLYRGEDALDFSQYGLRVATIEGWRRAVLLAAELRARGIDSERVPAELTTATLRNPFDESAFGWDAERAAVVYAGPENDRRVQRYPY
jgi:hypothetical protein